MIKRISALVFILIGTLIIINLGKQIFTALNSGKRLDQAVDELSKLQEQNQRLRSQLSQVQTYDYVEKTARDELNLSKPGETVVIIPQNSINHLLGLDKAPPPPPLPNWQGWLKLIFH